MLVFAVTIVASLEDDIADDSDDEEDDADGSGGDARASPGEVDQAASHDDEQMRGCLFLLVVWSLTTMILRSYDLDAEEVLPALDSVYILNQ